jgi:hypothetical protein
MRIGKNLWVRVISKTQRTCGIHERSSKELCISGQFLSLLSLGREGGRGMAVIYQNQFSDFLRIVVMCRVKPKATGFTGTGAHTRQKKKKKGCFKEWNAYSSRCSVF